MIMYCHTVFFLGVPNLGCRLADDNDISHFRSHSSYDLSIAIVLDFGAWCDCHSMRPVQNGNNFYS
jgi:hypothetical protein